MRFGLALIVALTLSCKSDPEPEAPAAPCSDVTCTTSGVDACAEGFTSDGTRGCTPVLPASPCTDNTYAVPGMTTCASAGVDECPAGFALNSDGCASTAPLDCAGHTIALLGGTSCEPIAVCGSGRYPATTVPTIYVDGAYTGTDSDGTTDKPFALLTDAIAKVDATKRVIAVAAGVYELGRRVEVAVEIIGVCPEKVSLTAPKISLEPVITTAADVTLRNVDVQGPVAGIRVDTGTTKVFSSRVHDTGALAGIITRAAGTLELDRVVISDALGSGVLIQSGIATIKNSEIRRSRIDTDGSGGVGVAMLTSIKRSPRLTIDRTILAHNPLYGVFARGAELTMRDSLVTDTGVVMGPEAGGVLASAGLVPPKVVITGTVIEDTNGLGIGAFDGTIEIDRTTVRRTRISKIGAAGLIFGVDPSTKKPNVAKVTRTLVTETDDMGVLVRGATVDLGATIVRSTKSARKEPSGRGIFTEAVGNIAPIVNVHDSLIEKAAGGGVAVTAGTTTLERVAIRDIVIASDGRSGMGGIVYIDNVAVRPTLTIKRSLIERVLEAGAVSFGARLEIEGSVIRTVGPRASNGFFGHGVHFSYDLEHEAAADGLVHGSLITDVREVGINVFMSSAEIVGTTITNVLTNPDGRYGDGITVSAVNLNAELYNPTTATIRNTKIANVARAGLSVFEADAIVSGLLSHCNPIDLTVETVFGKGTAKLADEGNNSCGCASLAACRAITSNIEPLSR